MVLRAASRQASKRVQEHACSIVRLQQLETGEQKGQGQETHEHSAGPTGPQSSRPPGHDTGCGRWRARRGFGSRAGQYTQVPGSSGAISPCWLLALAALAALAARSQSLQASCLCRARGWRAGGLACCAGARSMLFLLWFLSVCGAASLLWRVLDTCVHCEAGKQGSQEARKH